MLSNVFFAGSFCRTDAPYAAAIYSYFGGKLTHIAEVGQKLNLSLRG
jgi:hypothetical protein